MCRIAKEKARSGIAMCRSRRTVATIVLAGALAAGCAMPAAALADDASQGKTQVTVVADPGQTLKFEVPTVIPFAASADGVLVGPSKEVAKITNKSVFGIHVTEVGVEAKGAWNVVADAAKAPGQTKNAIDFQFGPARQVDAASALILPTRLRTWASTWDMRGRERNLWKSTRPATWHMSQPTCPRRPASRRSYGRLRPALQHKLRIVQDAM